MTEFATYTVNKLLSLSKDGESCFNQVLELATTPEHLADLKRKMGLMTSGGVESRIIDADECDKIYPLLNTGKLSGGRWSWAACSFPPRASPWRPAPCSC